MLAMPQVLEHGQSRKAVRDLEGADEARAVGADEPGDGAGLDAEIEPVERADAVEAAGEAANVEQRHGATMPLHHGNDKPSALRRTWLSQLAR